MGKKSHLAGPLSYDAFKKVNSLQLHAPFDETCREGAGRRATSHRLGRKQEKILTRLRQSLNVLVGIFVGILGVLMRYTYEGIWHQRIHLVRKLMEAGHGDDTSIWLRILRSTLVAGILTALLGVGAFCMVAWQPAASSSGIPGVIAFLNGCDIKNTQSRAVLVAKVLGTTFAVSAGLALGPEGPMIHIGALVGMLTVTRLMRPLLRMMGPLARRYEDELSRQPLRYHIQSCAMGAGAGIAAAFNAPLAGTVFVIEEAASYFSKKLFLHTFFTCGCAFLVAYALSQVLGMEQESFYLRTNCTSNLQIDLILVVQVAVVAFLCSLLAVAFNKAVVWFAVQLTTEFQTLGMTRRLLVRRFFIVVLVGMLCGTFTVAFPASMPCRAATLQRIYNGTSGCIPDLWINQLVSGMRPVNSSDLGEKPDKDGQYTIKIAYVPAPGLFGVQYDPVNCKNATLINPACRIDGLEPLVGNKTSDYCCGFKSLEDLKAGRFYSWSPGHLPEAPISLQDDRWPHDLCNNSESANDIQQYSPAAALVLVPPSTVLQNLLARGSPRVLPWEELAVFTAGYGMLVVVTTAAWVPGGLLVPTMIIGAAAGRLCGVVWFHFSQGSWSKMRPPISWVPEFLPVLKLLFPDQPFDSQPQPDSGLPPEPGVLAMAGSAAFLSGSGGLALFVLVLLIEITLEPFLIPIIIIAVMVARSTTSLLGTHSLYHELIKVQSLPFLDERAHWRQGDYIVADLLQEDARRAAELTGSTVDPEVTTPPLITLPRNASRAQIIEALRRCLPGDKLPMVNGFPVTDEDGRLCGLVTRDVLEKLLEETSNRARAPAPSLSASLSMTCELQNASLCRMVNGSPLTSAVLNEQFDDGIGVAHVMDAAPFVVPPSTPVVQAHMLFARCGLRHVVVVDSTNKPIGVLTRKSLMPWRTPWLDQSFMTTDTFLAIRSAHSPHRPEAAHRAPPGRASDPRASHRFPWVFRISARSET